MFFCNVTMDFCLQ